MSQANGYVIIWISKIQMLNIDWLFNGTSTQKGQFVPTVGRGKLALAAKDSQRDTMHSDNTLRYTIKQLIKNFHFFWIRPIVLLEQIGNVISEHCSF